MRREIRNTTLGIGAIAVTSLAYLGVIQYKFWTGLSASLQSHETSVVEEVMSPLPPESLPPSKACMVVADETRIQIRYFMNESDVQPQLTLEQLDAYKKRCDELAIDR